MPNAKTEWVALGYSVPASPSKARVFVWRRLRAINAQTLRPGVALLPNTKENIAAFTALSKKISEFSGDAVLIEMDFVDSTENTAMRERFLKAEEAVLRGALAECTALIEQIKKTSDPHRRATLKKDLDKKLSRVSDGPTSFKGQADELERAVGTLFDTLRGLPAEFAALLRR